MCRKQKNQIHIEVDGGITPTNISSVHHAGANSFVSATAIFGHPKGIAAGVQELRQALLK
jgi:ribulose-phosphate 3-epimerase